PGGPRYAPPARSRARPLRAPARRPRPDRPAHTVLQALARRTGRLARRLGDEWERPQTHPVSGRTTTHPRHRIRAPRHAPGPRVPRTTPPPRARIRLGGAPFGTAEGRGADRTRRDRRGVRWARTDRPRARATQVRNHRTPRFNGAS